MNLGRFAQYVSCHYRENYGFSTLCSVCSMSVTIHQDDLGGIRCHFLPIGFAGLQHLKMMALLLCHKLSATYGWQQIFHRNEHERTEVLNKTTKFRVNYKKN